MADEYQDPKKKKKKSSTLRQLALEAWQSFQNPNPGAAQRAGTKIKTRRQRLDEQIDEDSQ